MSIQIKNGLARTLVVIAVANLNGLSFMMFGITQVFSLALLFVSLALIFVHKRVHISRELVLYLLMVIGYLFFGMLYIPLFSDPQANMGEVQTVLGTILLTVSIVVYVQNLNDPKDRTSFFRFARNFLIISATANLFSRVLYSIYANPPPSAAYRSAGFFANPNDAAMIGLFAAIMILLFPFKSRLVQLAALVLVSFATFITFSRGPIMVMFFVYFLIIWNTRPTIRLLSIPVMIILLVSLYTNLSDLIDWFNTQTLFNLAPQQKTRVVSILMILDGQVDTETTGGRSLLFNFAVDKALSVFPFGTGLNSFQAMNGGLMGFSGNWLGAHNSFLMIWGESGFLVLIAMLAFISVTTINSFRSPNGGVKALFLPLLFVACAMFNHELFSLRFMNIATAFMVVQRHAIFSRDLARKPTNTQA